MGLALSILDFAGNYHRMSEILNTPGDSDEKDVGMIESTPADKWARSQGG
jgi:hypothetical protein